MATDKARINAYIDPAASRALKAAAYETDRSQTTLIEEALRSYLPTQSPMADKELKRVKPIRDWKAGGVKRRSKRRVSDNLEG